MTEDSNIMPTYLRKLPKVLYDFSLKTDHTNYRHVIPDLATKVSLYIDPDTVPNLTEKYYILQGETPEIIAHKYYNNVELHWTILVINKIADLGREWPQPDHLVYELAKDLYGEDHIDDIHHYEYGGLVMDSDYIESTHGVGTAIPITNVEHEVHENEKRRNILLIKPQYIAQFVKSFEDSLKV